MRKHRWCIIVQMAEVELCVRTSATGAVSVLLTKGHEEGAGISEEPPAKAWSVIILARKG
jgi:hypothetical protein